MPSRLVGGDTVEARLTALDAAVDGLLGDDFTGLSDDDIVEVLQRREISLRKASAAGHRLIVETTERLIPGRLGCRSVAARAGVPARGIAGILRGAIPFLR